MQVMLNLKAVLQQKKKTRYWLVKNLPSSYETVNNMVDHVSTSIHFNMLARLCVLLECTLGDLLILQDDSK